MIRFSRHARGRMKLYSITAEDVEAAVTRPDSVDDQVGASTAIKDFPGKYSGYPLKVVYEQYSDDILIITAYPLKKKAWR